LKVDVLGSQVAPSRQHHLDVLFLLRHLHHGDSFVLSQKPLFFLSRFSSKERHPKETRKKKEKKETKTLNVNPRNKDPLFFFIKKQKGTRILSREKERHKYYDDDDDDDDFGR